MVRAVTGQGVWAFEQEILAYGQNAARIFAVAESDPDCALASAYAGLAHIFRSTREGLALATPFIQAAVERAPGARGREQLMLQAIGHWHREDQAGARRALGALLAGQPDDLFAAKLLQILQFNAGDAPGMLRTIERVLPAHPCSAAAHGMHAFALDQCGRPADAERAARCALDLGADPWAHHALAHVMDRQRRYAEGRDWMTIHADDWSRCSSFLYTHNWWHAALFHLALGDHDRALALHDDCVWAVRKDYCQDQINAISLLARLEMAGVYVGDRWADVAAFVRPRRRDGIDGFLDLHYAFALARAGDDAAVADLLDQASAGDASDFPPWRRLMPAALGGVVAFARSDCSQAATLLGKVVPRLHLLGGSTVQRDLFVRILRAAKGHPPVSELAA